MKSENEALDIYITMTGITSESALGSYSNIANIYLGLLDYKQYYIYAEKALLGYRLDEFEKSEKYEYYYPIMCYAKLQVEFEKWVLVDRREKDTLIMKILHLMAVSYKTP